jgi:microcystin degradation protein MlrC
MRIATGGICHESSTLTPFPTVLEDFAEGFGIFRGEELFGRFTGTNIATGGFIEGAQASGFELVPLLWAFAYPSGVVQRAAYDTLKDELLERLASALPVEGVLLDQHGAMVVEGIDDADGDLIESVRAVVGPDCPIVVTYDLHSNHSQRRVAAADVSIGFDTFPHVDQAERGREAADLIVRLARGEIRAAPALVQFPLFWHPTKQTTGVPPWTEVIDRLHELEAQADVLTATVATGFPFSDVPHRGPSVIVHTDNRPDAAVSYAEELSDWIWSRRFDLVAPLLPLEEALDKGESEGRYPIIVADHADNTGAGSPGYSTEVLRCFVERQLEDALILYVVDPETVDAAREAGVGAVIEVAVGAKSHPAQGTPVRLSAEVMALSEGAFHYDGPMYAGLEGNLGRSAAIRSGGVTVVCVSKREQPLDPAFARTLGIDCAAMRYISVKSAAHFRSGFEAMAGSIFNVDAAALHTFDLANVSFRKARGPYFGIDHLD